MTGNSFAQTWPGQGARHGSKGQHRRPRSFAFAADKQALRAWRMAKGKGHRHHGRPSPDEIEDFIAMRRMHGGPFGGGPFRGGPFGGGPRGRGRGRARRGDVRLALLRLLAEEPGNGYQLMQTIEQRSEGVWRPSPGSVYPTLSQLEDEGLVRSVEEAGARRYEITDAGRDHLETRADEPAPWDAPEEEGSSARDVRPLIGSVAAAAWQVATMGDEAQREQAIELLTEARRKLYGILAEEPKD